MVSQTWSLTLDDCRLSLLAVRDHQVPLTLPAILSTLCPLFFWALPALLRWPPDPCPLLGSYMSSLYAAPTEISACYIEGSLSVIP